VLPDFSAGGTVTIDASNDTFALKVDGVQSGTVTLTQGTYSSGEALAAEIEARINADKALKDAGVSVDVSYDADDLIGEYLADDGLLDAREEGLKAGIDRVAEERERLERRLQALEARYRARFTALDVLLGQLSTTSAYLQQQLNQLAAVQAQARQQR